MIEHGPPDETNEEKRLFWLLVILYRVIPGLLVVLVVGVVVAIAIPGLFPTRRHADEAKAVGSLRVYAEAQIMSHRGDWVDSGTPGVLEYAHPYPKLYSKLENGVPIALIDESFATARGPNGTPRHGYLFLDMKTIGGKKINWVDDYALCATPAKYGSTGRRTFFINTTGTVWGKDLGESKFLKDCPLNPETEGWIIAE